jgi:hypothetical protein
MAAMETDPFLTHGTAARGTAARGRGKYDEGKSAMSGSGLLIMLPWLIFVIEMTLYSLVYHHFREVVWLVGIGGVALSVVFMSLTARMDGRWYLFLGVLCMIAVVMGNLAGLYNYHEYMLQYWSYTQNREYTNVLPSEPAASHADAGEITFAESARIDTTKAVGYKSGGVFCVAPIMDETQTSRVEYWAAGPDCCKQRADFTCDAASNPTARSGVVILDNNWLMPSNRDYYEKAVKQAEAAYDIVSAPQPLFIRWVENPGEFVQQEYYQQGIAVLISGIAIYLLVSVSLGVICAMSSRKAARPA